MADQAAALTFLVVNRIVERRVGDGEGLEDVIEDMNSKFFAEGMRNESAYPIVLLVGDRIVVDVGRPDGSHWVPPR